MLIALTPSFHPSSGIIPSTETVIQQMMKVAIRPMIMLCVAIVNIGRDKHTPIRTPRTADCTSSWNRR